jgi:MutS domain I
MTPLSQHLKKYDEVKKDQPDGIVVFVKCDGFALVYRNDAKLVADTAKKVGCHTAIVHYFFSEESCVPYVSFALEDLGTILQQLWKEGHPVLKVEGS